MKNCDMLCEKCLYKLRRKYPQGKALYIGKRQEIDLKGLVHLIRADVPTQKLAQMFGRTPRRIQQIAASVKSH